jgi:hypothetical protein
MLTADKDYRKVLTALHERLFSIAKPGQALFLHNGRENGFYLIERSVERIYSIIEDLLNEDVPYNFIPHLVSLDTYQSTFGQDETTRLREALIYCSQILSIEAPGERILETIKENNLLIPSIVISGQEISSLLFWITPNKSRKAWMKNQLALSSSYESAFNGHLDLNRAMIETQKIAVFERKRNDVFPGRQERISTRLVHCNSELVYSDKDFVNKEAEVAKEK